MTQAEKIKKVEELFDQIQELFPENSVSMNMHDIDITQLPDGWELKQSPPPIVAKRIKPKDGFFDITLFCKRNI